MLSLFRSGFPGEGCGQGSEGEGLLFRTISLASEGIGIPKVIILRPRIGNRGGGFSADFLRLTMGLSQSGGQRDEKKKDVSFFFQKKAGKKRKKVIRCIPVATRL